MSREDEFRRDFPGLETYIYNFAYIFKYAKLNGIDLNTYKDDTCKEKVYEDVDVLSDFHGFVDYILKDECEKDKYLKLAVDGIVSNLSEIKYSGLLQFFDKLTIEELTNIALWNIDTSIYNMGTPESLIDLSIGLLESHMQGNEILDLGTYNGNFLVNYAKKYPNYIFNGLDINYQSSDITALRLALLGVRGQIRQADEFLCINEEYNKIFSNHSFMPRATEIMLDTINKHNGLDVEFTPIVSPDWFFVEKARQFIGSGGKAVCVVLDSSLSKKTDNYIRRRLVEEGWIESIIALPSKIFPYSNISSSIVVLSSNNTSVKFIDATSLYDSERRINKIRVNDVLDIYNSINSNSENSKIVSNKELMENDYMLNVENYLDNYKVDLINPVPLETVTKNIFRGYQITAKEMDNNIKTDKYFKKYKVLNVGNINDGIIDNNLDSVYVDKENLNKYIIQNGDILLSCKSSKIKIALYESKGDDNVIASGNLIVIRPDTEKINPAYLRMFLDSEKGNKLLYSIQTGASIISINPSALKGMNISLLDYETQTKLANSYMSKLDNLNMYKKRIIELEDEIKNFSNGKF